MYQSTLKPSDLLAIIILINVYNIVMFNTLSAMRQKKTFYC